MSRKILASGLVVSLVINFILIGFLIGRESAGFYGPDPIRPTVRWMRGLDEERRAELRPMLRERMKRHANWRELRKLHVAFRDAVRAEPFDPEALKERLAAMRGNFGAMLQHHDQTFIEFVSQLTDQERAELAEQLARRPNHDRFKRHPQVDSTK